jgi:hypothetical protein
MNANPRLIVNCRHFITINSKEPWSIKNFFSCGEENVLQSLCNFSFCIIVPMFFWSVFHIQELKQLHCLKGDLFSKAKKITN